MTGILTGGITPLGVVTLTGMEIFTSGDQVARQARLTASELTGQFPQLIYELKVKTLYTIR